VTPSGYVSAWRIASKWQFEFGKLSGWWFQTFFIFHNIWDNPFQLTFIFFRGVAQPPTSDGSSFLGTPNKSNPDISLQMAW